MQGQHYLFVTLPQLVLALLLLVLTLTRSAHTHLFFFINIKDALLCLRKVIFQILKVIVLFG